jgi:DNA uptake protein ComE-like DNA-binding protein
MKKCFKVALVVASLTLFAGMGFAADVKSPSVDLKSATKAAGDSITTDAKAAVSADKAAAKAKATEVKSVVKAKIVDINSATEAELKAIPGIGDAYAAKIAAGRPYANKAQLKSRKIIPDTVYEQVKDLIIARLVKK